MLLKTALIWAALTTGISRASIFQFSDAAGFEKCMLNDHLVEETKTDKGSEKKYLDVSQIKMRCIESAAKLLSSEKGAGRLLSFLTVARENASALLSIPLVQTIALNSPSTCNEMKVYEVLTKSLDYPFSNSTTDKNEFLQIKKAVDACLRDKTFQKDFMEEKDSSKPDLAKNACRLLQQQKLVSQCPSK
jgi:hypothetical protein